jgi:diguanylate cyclase (GGDEF)-like protein
VDSSDAVEVLDRLVTFLERTSDLVGVTDDQGNILYLNRSARGRLGVHDDPELPLTTAELFPQEAFDIYFDQIRPRILGGDVWTGYLPIRGSVEPIEMWATVVGETRPGGEVAWMVLAARDVNDWRYVPEGHQRHAAYDELTGLATRSLLMDHLAKAQTRAARTGNEVAVAFIDIDDMKMVNHSFGSTFGDAVLAEIAHRLRDAVRVIDTVARVGGDQFVVLFDGVADEGEVAALTTQIQATLESAAVDIDGRVINVSASVGTAMARDGELGDQLLGRADTAMYEVKADRRHQHGRPAPTIGPDLRSVTLKDLAVAVTRRDIVPYFQRVVDARTGDTRAVQALARWLRPNGVAVDAGQFLGIADESGVSFSLDLAMLRHAGAELAPRPELGRLYMPVSPRFLRHPGVDRFVHEVLSHAGLPPDRLAVLVPEHLVATQALVVGDALATLRELGVHLVLDTRPADDGAGGASSVEGQASRKAAREDDIASMFGELRLAPGWIAVLERDPEAVSSVVRAALERGQRVLVGGVETEDQRRRLVDLGCGLLSGHLFAAPAAQPG